MCACRCTVVVLVVVHCCCCTLLYTVCCILLYTVVVVLCCTGLLLYFGVHCCVAKEHGSPGRTPGHSRPGHGRSRCVDKYQGFKQTVSPALFSSMSIATHPHILLTVWACGSACNLFVCIVEAGSVGRKASVGTQCGGVRKSAIKDDATSMPPVGTSRNLADLGEKSAINDGALPWVRDSAVVSGLIASTLSLQ